MTTAFSVLSWNVEHFRDDPARVAEVVRIIADIGPDVFALYEVEGKRVFAELVSQMPDYQFHITEGPQVQEILVGVRGGLSAFFTQKIEFRAGTTSMRPGALLTLRIDGDNYPILFLHLSSGPDPRGWGLRDEMLERALDFKKVLKKAAEPGRDVNYIFLGDLNTMGLKYLIKKFNMSPDVELEKIDKLAKRADMRRLPKTAAHTWSNGSKSRFQPADLDQVVASANLVFRDFSGMPVHVLGWAELQEITEQDAWISRYSDHCPIYFEVLKP